MLSWCHRIFSLSGQDPRQGWKPSYKTCSSSDGSRMYGLGVQVWIQALITWQWPADKTSSSSYPGLTFERIASWVRRDLQMIYWQQTDCSGRWCSRFMESVDRNTPSSLDLLSWVTTDILSKCMVCGQYSLQQRTSSSTYCDLDPFYGIS